MVERKSGVVLVGTWDMLLGVITSGFWIVLIYAFPSMAIADQEQPQ